MQQRRNRGKPREVSDHAMLAIHKYYLRADHMRRHFMTAADELIAIHGKQSLNNYHNSMEYFRAWTFRDYWMAGIFAAMEGYEKLGLANPDVEKLRSDPQYSKLRSFRAGIYHFREKYFDEAVHNFFELPGAADWLVKLDTALGQFLTAEVQRRAARREARARATHNRALCDLQM
jgi:hypothetical protein